METKIRKSIEVAENSSIKIVPTSVAILSVLHENNNFEVFRYAGAVLKVEDFPLFVRNYDLAILKRVGMATVVVLVISPIGGNSIYRY